MTHITRAVLEGRWRWQRVTMRPTSTYKDGEEQEGRGKSGGGKGLCGMGSEKGGAVWGGWLRWRETAGEGTDLSERYYWDTGVGGEGGGRVQSLYITTHMSRDFIFLQVHVFSQYIRFFALYTISALYHDFASPVVVKISGICCSYLIQINEEKLFFQQTTWVEPWVGQVAA